MLATNALVLPQGRDLQLIGIASPSVLKNLMAQGLQLGKYWISGGIGLRNHFIQKEKKKKEKGRGSENLSESHLIIIIHAQ